MRHSATLHERIAANRERLSPAERDVARFFQDNREQVMVASAQALAARIGTSDATVGRATRALGYAGMKAMRPYLSAHTPPPLPPPPPVPPPLPHTGSHTQPPFH